MITMTEKNRDSLKSVGRLLLLVIAFLGAIFSTAKYSQPPKFDAARYYLDANGNYKVPSKAFIDADKFTLEIKELMESEYSEDWAATMRLIGVKGFKIQGSPKSDVDVERAYICILNDDGSYDCSIEVPHALAEADGIEVVVTDGEASIKVPNRFYGLEYPYGLAHNVWEATRQLIRAIEER